MSGLIIPLSSCRKRLLTLLLLFITMQMVINLILPIRASADTLFEGSLDVITYDQQDQNGDSTPDSADILTDFLGRKFRITVIDQGGDMQWSDDWQFGTDFLNDVWIFDAGADGSAQLIVDFEVESENYVALVYDDIDGDGQVRYQISDDQVTIAESEFWHVKVFTNQPWNHSGISLATETIFQVDGYYGLGLGVGQRITEQERERDGVVDWLLETGDQNGDGIIDYQLQRVISPSFIQLSNPGIHKSVIHSQVSGDQPTPYKNTLFWPFLTDKHNYAEYRYFDHPPVIAVDWESGVIDRIGIQGYPIEEGYHIYSRLPLEKDVINDANFEVPMAYYDLAEDHDGWPELQVRFDVAVSYNPYFPFAGGIETPNLEVNYSWDQDNDNRWDYKMNLGSNRPIEDVVLFPDFAIKMVPYEEIIPWVKDHTWDIVMLVYDDRPSPDSEGMFGKGWMIHRGYANGEHVQPSWVRREYMMGFRSQPPMEAYQDIQGGMRGEYSFQYFDTPKVYLSALDRQLHLYGAQAGVWNLGDGHYLRYANLDGDPYLDHWQEELEGSLVQQINYAHGVVLYGGESRVRLIKSDIDPAMFETQPPGNNEDWLALNTDLDRHQPAFAPDDFEAMLAQFEGPASSIAGASLRDFRLEDSGFRFVLDLQSGFSLAGGDLLGLRDLAPGEYLVVFDGFEFVVQPLTPAAILVDDIKIQDDIAIHVSGWTTIETPLRNLGLEDIHDLSLCLDFAGPLGEKQLITTTLGLLPGGSTQVLGWDWSPPSPGTWHLTLGTGCNTTGDGLPRLSETLGTMTVEVLPAKLASSIWRLTLGGFLSESYVWLLVAFLLSISALSGGIILIWARSRQAGDQA